MNYAYPDVVMNSLFAVGAVYSFIIIMYAARTIRKQRESLQKECSSLKKQRENDKDIIETLKSALRTTETKNEQTEENLDYLKAHVMAWADVHKDILPKVCSMRHDIREAHEMLWTAIYDKEPYDKLAARQAEVKKVIKNSLSIVDDLLRSFEAEFVRLKISQDNRIDFLECCLVSTANLANLTNSQELDE